MENIYSKFLGIGFQNKVENIKNYGLSRSSSMPFYSSFQARKLPNNLSEYIPYKPRKEGITSSDMKVQMLEEKIRQLENKQMHLTQSLSLKRNKDAQISNNPTIQPIIIQQPLLLNNNTNLNKKIDMAKSYEINNEIFKSRLKLNNYRGLQKNDYEQYTPYYNSSYKSIFDRKKNKEEKKEIKNQNLEKKYLNEGINEINDIKNRIKAKKFVNKLDEEIYTPIENDYKDYMNNVNQNIQQRFEEDNKIIKQDINQMEKDFSEIKDMLNQKLEQMEMKQKNNFEKLKNVIKSVGGKKMSTAIENVFEGKNYDLQKAEDEYLVNEVFNLPNLINQKRREEELNSIEKEKLLKRRIKEEMDYELEKKREIEKFKHLEKLKLMEVNKEKQRIENMRNLNRLRYEIIQANHNKYDNYINNMNIYNYGINDLLKIYLLKKMNGNGGGGPTLNPANISNMGTDELLKYMLLKNMGLDNLNNNSVNDSDNDSYVYYPYYGTKYNINQNMYNRRMNNLMNNRKDNTNDNNKNEESNSIIKKKSEKKTSKNSGKTKEKSSKKSKSNKSKSKSKSSKSKSKTSKTNSKSKSNSNSSSSKSKDDESKSKSEKSDEKSSKEKKDESKDDDKDDNDKDEEEEDEENENNENEEKEDDEEDEDNNN